MRYRNMSQVLCTLIVLDSSNRELRFPCEPGEPVDVPDEFDRVVPTLAPQLRKDEEPGEPVDVPGESSEEDNSEEDEESTDEESEGTPEEPKPTRARRQRGPK